MNSKITKRRLAIGLSYDWIKIVALVLGICFFWVIAYTIGAPRASTGQQFHLFVYTNGFNAYVGAEDVLDAMKNDGAFSYDVLSFNTRTMTSDTYETIIGTVTYASEGDVMICSNYTSDENPNDSDFKSFIDNYGTQLFDYESIIKSAKEYCTKQGLIYLDSTTGEYKTDNAKIRSYFASRMQKDPRYRNKESEKYEQGVLNEIERIKLIWNNANTLEQCLEQHPELKSDYRRYEQYLANNEDDEEALTYYNNETVKTWGINLGALTDGANSITDVYSSAVYDEEGNLIGVSADNIVICVFSYINAQPDHVYESLGAVNYFIKNYSNFMDGNFENLIA